MKKETEEGDEPQAETESESEEELPCFAPTVSTVPIMHWAQQFAFLLSSLALCQYLQNIAQDSGAVGLI